MRKLFFCPDLNWLWLWQGMTSLNRWQEILKYPFKQSGHARLSFFLFRILLKNCKTNANYHLVYISIALEKELNPNPKLALFLSWVTWWCIQSSCFLTARKVRVQFLGFWCSLFFFSFFLCGFPPGASNCKWTNNDFSFLMDCFRFSAFKQWIRWTMTMTGISDKW